MTISQEQSYHVMNTPDIIAYLQGLIEECGYGKFALKLSYSRE